MSSERSIADQPGRRRRRPSAEPLRRRAPPASAGSTISAVLPRRRGRPPAGDHVAVATELRRGSFRHRMAHHDGPAQIEVLEQRGRIGGGARRPMPASPTTERPWPQRRRRARKSSASRWVAGRRRVTPWISTSGGRPPRGWIDRHRGRRRARSRRRAGGHLGSVVRGCGRPASLARPAPPRPATAPATSVRVTVASWPHRERPSTRARWRFRPPTRRAGRRCRVMRESWITVVITRSTSELRRRQLDRPRKMSSHVGHGPVVGRRRPAGAGDAGRAEQSAALLAEVTDLVGTSTSHDGDRHVVQLAGQPLRDPIQCVGHELLENRSSRPPPHSGPAATSTCAAARFPVTGPLRSGAG